MRHLLWDDEFTRRKGRLLASVSGRVLEFDERSSRDAPLERGAFDTIVIVHTLCSVDDVDAALQRVDELLAPGGRVLLLEHVRAMGLRGRTQDAATPLWRHATGGCRANRDPIAALRRNGFAVTDCDRFRLRRSLPIVAPHISAVAIRKAVPTVSNPTETETA